MPGSAAEEQDLLGARWARPLPPRAARADAGLAAALLALALVSVPVFVLGQSAAGARPPLWATAAWTLVITVPLAWRRRFPAGVAVVVAGAFLLGQATGNPERLVSQISLFTALYTVGAWGAQRRRSIVVRAGVVAAVLVWLAAVLVTDFPQDLPGGGAGGGGPQAAVLSLTVLQTLLFLAGAVALGESSRLSARRLAALQVRTGQLIAERERTSAQAAAQAVSAERLRIARELHDVVAHHVSAMGVQAAAARRVLLTAPARASGALATIESSARSAVDEMHRVLVALRSDGEQATAAAASQAPSALGVDQLPGLVAQAQASGTPAALTVDGRPRPVPATTGLTVYRLAQEALTNARKHAGPGARAEVRLRYHPDAVELVVEDHGGDRSPAPPGPGGPGLGGLGQLGDRKS
ncbi:MAG: Two-component system sensor histidine kinase, partial [uncultured Quadrisphaera sp.]